MPTSTTHALTGALAGVGLAAAGLGQVNWAAFGGKFATPLLVSPLLAIAATTLVYPLLRWSRKALGVERETCLCVGEGAQNLVPLPGGAAAMSPAGAPVVALVDSARCVERYQGRFVGVEAQKVVDVAHYCLGRRRLLRARRQRHAQDRRVAARRRRARAAGSRPLGPAAGGGDDDRRRAAPVAPGGRDHEPQDHRPQPGPGADRQPGHRRPGARRLAARPAGDRPPTSPAARSSASAWSAAAPAGAPSRRSC